MQGKEGKGIGEDFIQRQGPAYLAHLLRRLSDELVRGADAWYPEVGVTAPCRGQQLKRLFLRLTLREDDLRHGGSSPAVQIQVRDTGQIA